MRLALTLLLVLGFAVSASADADIAGPFGSSTTLYGFSGRYPLAGRIGSGAPASTGDILLVDGTSLILQTDGSSLICLAGGC